MTKLNFKNKYNTAFTLVETLVAISIFTTSLLILMVVLGGSLSNTTYAKEKTVATYLAQEGIEYMRNMRDTFMLYGSTPAIGWSTFNNNKLLPASCGTVTGCYFDNQINYTSPPAQAMTTINLTNCGSTCPAITYDSATGKYGYGFSTATGYVRKITAKVISANETQILSTVTWQQGSGSYSITFSENLFNWIE